MDVESPGDGTVNIGMRQYIKEAIIEFGEVIPRRTTTQH